MFCLGMVSTNLYIYGGDTTFKVPKAGNGNVFFPNKRVRFARADTASCSSTVQLPVKHRHQRMYSFYPIVGVIVGR